VDPAGLYCSLTGLCCHN